MLSFLRMVLRVFFRVTVRGEPPLAGAGKLLFIANHESRLDALLLGIFLPGKPVVVVPPEEKKGWLMRAALAGVPHAVLETGDPGTVKKVIRLLDSGHVTALFPEGRITRTGSLMKIYDVPALIAIKTGARIVPVKLEGTGRLPFNGVSGRFPKQWFPKITLHMGPAVSLSRVGAGLPRQRRRAAALELLGMMQAIHYAARSRQTLFPAFLDAVAAWGRRTKVIEDVRWTEESYGQLVKTSLALGKWVCRFSREKEAIGILLPNVSTTVSLVLGITAAGRVAAMLNYTAGASGMESACVAANISTVITSRKFLEAAKLAPAERALGCARIVYMEDFHPQFRFVDRLWLMGFALWWPRRAFRKRDPGEPAVIMFTSGSEDRPKGVALSHDAILANVAQIKSVIDFGPGDKFLNALPMYHTYGFTGCTILPLLIGAKLLLYVSPIHYRLIPEIAYRRNCTCLFGTGAFLGRYAEHAHSYDFYRVRYVVSGGEKLGEEVRRTWLEKFALRVLDGYGASECAPVLALGTPMAYKAGSVGRFLPGIEYRLEPVPGIDRGGVLHVRGPNVMLGYYLYHAPGVLQPPRSLFGEGWHNTGDVVEVDEEGFVTIKGRVKRFAKIAGEMVSLEVAEDIACHASPHHQHAAVMQEDAQRGEAVILFTTDPHLDRIALSRAAKQLGSPELAVPRGIIQVEALPLLGTGKTDYVKLKGLAQAEPEADFAEIAPP